MKLISWNVNGIRASVKKGFLQFLEDENPDILCIQETKAHKEQLTSEILEDHGYFTYWHSGERKGYSGVSTFCKGEPVYVQRGLGIDKYDKEGRVLVTEHEHFYFIIFIFQMVKKMRKGLNISLIFMMIYCRL